jgi:crotonobetainyl-CoA:carnitine CoA-transferase CaiB-like acyl-CoA transferase
VASPFRIGEPLPARPAPKLGQHTEELLRELGYDEREIRDLKRTGTV